MKSHSHDPRPCDNQAREAPLARSIAGDRADLMTIKRNILGAPRACRGPSALREVPLARSVAGDRVDLVALKRNTHELLGRFEVHLALREVPLVLYMPGIAPTL